MEKESDNFFPCDSITIRTNRFVDVVVIHEEEALVAYRSVGDDIRIALVGLMVWDLGSGSLLSLGVGLKVRSLVASEQQKLGPLQVTLSTGNVLVDFY